MRATPRSTATRAATFVYVALAAVDTALAASPSVTWKRLRLITKPLLMPALGSAFSASLSSEDVHGGGLLRGGTVAGQALSGVGDIALLGKGRPAFLAGMGAFGAAHLSYTTAFVSAGRPVSNRSGVAGVAVAMTATAALAPAFAQAAARKDAKLRGPVLGYAAVVTGTVVAAARLDLQVPRRARSRVLIGAALCMVSDTTLAAREFALARRAPLLDGAVMASYTLGQGLIAAGVSQAARQAAVGRESHDIGTVSS